MRNIMAWWPYAPQTKTDDDTGDVTTEPELQAEPGINPFSPAAKRTAKPIPKTLNQFDPRATNTPREDR